MKTTTLRTPTSFRLPTYLIEELRQKAKASNRSLNNYVEDILMHFLNHSTHAEEGNVSQELQAKIDKAREEYRNGETLHFGSRDEMNKWLNSL